MDGSPQRMSSLWGARWMLTKNSGEEASCSGYARRRRLSRPSAPTPSSDRLAGSGTADDAIFAVLRSNASAKLDPYRAVICAGDTGGVVDANVSAKVST